MPISQAIAEFESVLDKARAELAEVNTKISELEREQHRVTRLPPHTDDIVALFQRGFRRIGRDFESKFAGYLNSTFTDHGSAEKAREGSALNILSLNIQGAERAAEVVPGLISKNGRVDLDVMILTYFLRDRIEAEIPALVEKLCPDARNGMKSADRKRVLNDLEAKLGKLRGERAGLEADLNAARTAVTR